MPQIIFLLYFFFIVPNKCSLYLFDLFSCVSWNLCFKCPFSTGAIYAVQLYSSIVSRCFYLLHHPRAVTAGSSATWGGGATNYYASCLANYLLHMQTQKITCTKRRCTNNFGICEALVSASLIRGCSAASRQASSWHGPSWLSIKKIKGWKECLVAQGRVCASMTRINHWVTHS